MQSSTVKVLIVDDAEAVQALTRRTLERAGYVVLSAGNGEEAIRVLRSASVDLVLLDMHMPVMNGPEFLAIRAKDPDLKRIPVLLYSSDPKPTFRSEEVSGPLLKPALDEELLRSVERLVRR